MACDEGGRPPPVTIAYDPKKPFARQPEINERSITPFQIQTCTPFRFIATPLQIILFRISSIRETTSIQKQTLRFFRETNVHLRSVGVAFARFQLRQSECPEDCRSLPRELPPRRPPACSSKPV